MLHIHLTLKGILAVTAVIGLLGALDVAVHHEVFGIGLSTLSALAAHTGADLIQEALINVSMLWSDW